MRDNLVNKSGDLVKDLVNDCISRAAAIEICRKAKDKSQAHRMLTQLPSVQPGEDIRAMCGECDAWNQYKNYPQPRWIPCSERCPDKSEWYLVTAEWDDGLTVTAKDRYIGGEGWTCAVFGAKCLAWMPLPEPYEERKDDEQIR